MNRFVYAAIAAIPILISPLLLFALAEGWVDFGGGLNAASENGEAVKNNQAFTDQRQKEEDSVVFGLDPLPVDFQEIGNGIKPANEHVIDEDYVGAFLDLFNLM